jgi:DNA (cytosine-5)-methyltransferase 1
MKIVDLFSGIGGFSYAAEKLVGGFETVAFVEREPYCQKVLRKHWHNVPIFSDIRSFDGKEFRDADIVVGGFPCQPWSVAGEQRGDSDDRDLWHEMVRVIEDIRPRWIIGENVRGFVNMPMGLKRSLFDLESIGYKAAPFIIPACAADAKHRRERCWIVGHTEHDGSSTPKVRRSYNPNDERTSERSQQTFQFEGASGREHDEDVAHTESNGLLPRNGGLCGGESIGLHGDEERNGNEVRSETIGCSRLQGETREADDVAHANSDTKRRTHGKDVGIGERGREDIDSGKRNKVRSDTSDSSCDGREKEKGDVPYTNGSGLQGLGGEPGSVSEQEARHSIGGNSQENERDRRLEIGSGPIWWKPEPRVGRVAHGVSNRTHRIKSLGNSIVPQVAARLFWAIKEAENERTK